ncbi:hypothetical protein H4S00_003367, partial [Coemansia sp. D1744]
MSEMAPFQTAWDTVFAGSKSLSAYAIQALNSGLITHAALGRRRCTDGSLSIDMLAAVDTLLVLFAVEGPGTSMNPVCSTPVFSAILDIAFLCKEPTDTLAQAANELQQGLFLVLSEGGQLVLVGIENCGDKRRLTAVQHSKVFMENEDGSEPRLIRKLVADPLSRAVAIVSWLDYIEIAMLAWDSSASDAEQLPRICDERIHISTNGAICDAAILMPSQSETQRVLLVVAILDSERQVYFLYLYEIWTYNNSAPSLVAKLPLPFDIATPLRIVPLPAFPEHFVLVTEREIVLASALQLLSGDIHLYSQPLPRLSNDTADLVRSCCVAETAILSASDVASSIQASKEMLRSPLLGRRTSATASPRLRDTSAGCELAQLLYISLQSGTLLRVCAAPVPLLLLTEITPASMNPVYTKTGDVMLHLGRESPHLDQTVFDYVFLSGDCTANAIARITAPNDHNGSERSFSDTSESAVNMDAPLCWIFPVLENQSPIVDFTLQKDRTYLTTGYADNGAVCRAQFGHAVRLLGNIRSDADRDSSSEPVLVAPVWSLYVPSPSHSGDLVWCAVMQHAGSYIPVIEDGNGGWQIFEELRSVIADRHLTFISNIDDHRILCVFRDSIDIATLECGSFQTDRLADAGYGDVFTHGSCVVSDTGCAWAAVAGLATHQASLHVFRIPAPEETDKQDTLLPLFKIALSHEVSCLRIFTVDTGVVIVSGTYAPALHMYWVDPGSLISEPTPIPIDLKLMQASGKQEDLGDCMDIDTNPVVSDIYVLYSSTSLYILVGLRDGRMVWSASDVRLFAGMVNGTHGALPLFGEATFVEVGKVPVSFASTTLQLQPSAHTVFMCSGLPYMIKAGRLSQLEITPCTGESNDLESIHCIVPLTTSAVTESTGCEAGRFLATFSTGGASVLEVEFQARCSICPYPVDSEPRRVVVDPDTGMLLVASVVRPQDATDGVAFSTSCLKVIDPGTGSICAEVRFQPFELVCSLATWHIRGLKSYRYVCVGTTQFSEQTDGQSGLTRQAVGGRLVIYNLKPRRKPRKTQLSPDAGQNMLVDPGFELKYVWESDRNGPVSALSSLGDSYLVVAVSTTILVLKLDIVQRQLIECCECSLRFAATSIDVCGTNIVVGSKREAVNLLRFTPAQSDGTSERLDLVHSARFGANTADARFLASDLVAGVDHNGFLFVVGVPGDSVEFALDFVLGMHLGIPCSRLQVGRLVRRLDDCAHIVP